MPRKLRYGVDYDEEDYLAYDDYDDDYNYNHNHNSDEDVHEKASRAEQGHDVVTPGVWRCSICTYDNEESSSFCEMCGVIPHRPVNVSNNGDAKAAKSAQLATSRVPSSTGEKKSATEVIPNATESSSILLPIAGKHNQNQRKSSTVADEKLEAPTSKISKSSTVANEKLEAPTSKLSKSSTVANEKLEAPTSKLSKSSTVASEKLEAPTSKLSKSSTVANEKLEAPTSKLSKSSTVANEKLEPPTSKLSNLTLDIKAESSRTTTNTRRTTSSAQYKPEPWMLSDAEKDGFCQLSLAIVGHVDTGKSTLSGRLLHLLGRISQKEMHKYQKDAKEMGKGSFAYAWAMDESAEERERGVTMTVAVAFFDTKKYHVVVLDSPGHKDFVPNMISGATQADAAILVVDASVGAFEVGMGGNGGGQTKEHAQLIRSFGVEQVIIAVNKMDAVNYSQERFDFIKSQLGPFLRSCGFKESSVAWIPLSAIENQNLVTAASESHLSSWYQGPYLLDAIDSFKPPVRDISKPLRMPICDVIEFRSTGQVAATGKLGAGAIRIGSKVLVLPSGDSATVQSMKHDSHNCSVAKAGDNVSVSLQGVDGSCLMTGAVLCHPDFPVAIAICLELKVLVLDVSAPILIGSQVEFHVHHAKEAARVVKILSVVDPKTGKISKRAPRCVIAKQGAVIEVVLDRPVCVEEFSECKALGRVFLRASGKTIAVGIITQIIE